MEKLAQTWASTLSLFQKRFESFLDNDFETNHLENDKIRQKFEATRDVTLIRGISQGLPDDHIDRTVVAFSRLSMCFESGIMLENHDGRWKPQAFFHRGVTELLKAPSKVTVSIPPLDLLTVLKTSAAAVLEKVQLQHLDPENKTSCLLIKATPDYAFFLFSELPDIWLKDHAEHVLKALTSGFAE